MADTINTLNHYKLPAFAQPEARALLNTLAAAYAVALGEDEIAVMLDAIRWHQPFYIQLAFSKLRGLIKEQPEALLAELIEQAADRMIQPGEDNDFHYWEERLSIQLPQADAGHCVALLGQASATPEGERPELLLAALHERIPQATGEEARQTFIRLRDILLRDAYWVADERGDAKRYRFLLEPLRRWWSRRNAL